MRNALNTCFKWGYILLEAVLAFIFLYLLVFLGGGIPSTGEIKNSGDVQIFVKSNGVHTDFCLPVDTTYKNWLEWITPKDFPDSDFKYVSIGWGDKGFFLDTPTWTDLSFKTAFNAAFLPSETAMHVAWLNHIPEINEHCREVYIDEVAYKDLTSYIESSFQLKDDNPVLIPGRGYWSNDSFYEATGSYSCFKTCNSWTNKGLKICGIKTGWFSLSAEGIMRHLNH